MNLQELDAADNLLTSLPPEFGSLASLTYLQLSGNRLAGFPSSLWNMPNLGALYLSDNRLIGPIPAALSANGMLQVLTLTGNPLVCWESQAAFDWALGLDYYEGPRQVCVNQQGYFEFLPAAQLRTAVNQSVSGVGGERWCFFRADSRKKHHRFLPPQNFS